MCTPGIANRAVAGSLPAVVDVSLSMLYAAIGVQGRRRHTNEPGAVAWRTVTPGAAERSGRRIAIRTRTASS
jgi:hypothetical protein